MATYGNGSPQQHQEFHNCLAPNTLLLGWEPLLIPDQILTTSNQKAEDYIAKFQKNRLMAILALNKAASAHAPVSSKYSQGQRVWLEGKNLPISHGTIKLSPKRYGPFTITKLISPVASHRPPRLMEHSPHLPQQPPNPIRRNKCPQPQLHETPT